MDILGMTEKLDSERPQKRRELAEEKWFVYGLE